MTRSSNHDSQTVHYATRSLLTCVGLCLLLGIPIYAQKARPSVSPAVSDEIAPDQLSNPGPTALIPVSSVASASASLKPFSTPVKPQTFHERFKDYAICAFGPRAFFTPVIWAGLRMANPPSAYPHEWRSGIGGFGRNYGNAFAWQTSLETARFLTGALLHEDFRYQKSTSKNPWARTLHALAFTVVDKSDSGHNQIAFANFAGAEASGIVGNLYLPSGYANFTHAENRAAYAFAGLAARNLFHEFLPERMKGSHGWLAMFSRHPVPEWWDKRNDH
jgi:hypothetical protein